MITYPTTLDNTTDLKDDADNDTITLDTHPLAHNNIADAIIAIETELGVLPKGSYATVAANLLDGVKKSPAADQIVRPTGDFIALALRASASQSVANMLELRASNQTVLGYWDKVGNFSATAYKVSGVPLSSFHLNDSASLLLNPSVVLTGVPTAPTAGVDTNTAQVATTSFVLGQASSATPLADAGSGTSGTSPRFSRADHTHPLVSSGIALIIALGD